MRGLAARIGSTRIRPMRFRRSANVAGPLYPITYPATPLRGLVEIAPGADLTADPATWSWVDITQWVRHDLGISTVVGRRDQGSFVDPSRASLKLDNRDGRFSRRNPLGPYYDRLTRNTPIRLAVDPGDGMHYRYYGHVNEWPKRWDKSGNDSTVTITCGGSLRRLQRAQGLRSALFRSMAGVAEGDFQPQAYWSMEDGSDAFTFAPGVTGGRPAQFSGGLSLAASNDGLAGSEPLPTLATGTVITFPVAGYANTQQWVVQLVINLPVVPAANTTLLDVYTPGGTAVRWRLSLVPNLVFPPGLDMKVEAFDIAGASVDSETAVIETDTQSFGIYGNWLMLSVAVYQDGPDVRFRLGNQGPHGDQNVVSNSFVGTHSGVQSMKLPAAGAGLNDAGFGHVALFVDANFTIGVDDLANAAAMDGWVGELAHERIRRLCREEGVRLHCVAGTSAALGSQPLGTLLDVLRDAERVDVGGVLYEHEFGLGYQALSERYSQPVQMALDFADGHVNDPPEADDSDLRFRNQWTVRREGGSEATARAEDFDAADGLSPGASTVNAYLDDQLEHIAGWLVHRDTADEDYWTGLKLSFSRTPDIIPAWTGLPFGARLTVANPPTQADPGNIDAIVEGWSERWDQVTWEATLNTSPASTLEVPVWDDLGFLWDSGSSSLTADISDSATSISVTTTNADDLWVTGAVAFDIEIGGEQLSVTNISSATSPQTFTVTRAVNAISKPHLAGADVRLWSTPIWGLT